MSEFKRGLSERFIDALRLQSKPQGWWQDVLRDNTLIIGIRDESFDVYWRGQSIFFVTMRKDGSIGATTHPKYLLNPALSKRVRFDGTRFAIDKELALIETYVPGETLGMLKRAAALFAGPEKYGVHDIVLSNDNVVDVEAAMYGRDVADAGDLPRADIVAFEDNGDGVHLCFWEAKTFYNPELRVAGEKNVVGQFEKYKSVIRHHRKTLVESYIQIARNLAAISEMSGKRRRIGETIRQVADGAPLAIRQPADVGLIVFGFDASQRDQAWKKTRAELAGHIDIGRIKAAGQAKRIKL